MVHKFTGLKDGLNYCSNEEYHTDRKYLSSSVVKKLYTSLEEYHKEYVLGIKPERNQRSQDALNMGSYIHTAILEPHLLDKEYTVFEGTRRGQAWESFAASNTDRKILTETQHIQAEQMLRSFHKREIAVKLLQNGYPEQTLCGSILDVPIKARFDYIDPINGIISDVKTTGEPSGYEYFKITARDLYYQLSAALYCTIAEQFYGKKFEFYFVVLSKRDYGCEVYKAGDFFMSKGAQQVTEGLSKYKRARETNIWTEPKHLDSLLTTDATYEVREL